MEERIIASMGVGLGVICVFLLVLAVGGIIADHVLPRIPFLRRFVDNLPMMARAHETAPARDYLVKRAFGPFRPGERFRVIERHDCGVTDILGYARTEDAMLNWSVDERVLTSHCEPIA